MKFPQIRTTAFVLAACVAAGAAFAQANARGDAARFSGSDEDFLKQAAQNGHAEVESGKLAIQKAEANAQVKRFAQMMVTDHQKTGEELKALAASKGLEVPTEPSIMQRAKLKLLSTSDGENFSRGYIESMGVGAHKETIELFEEAAKEADSAEVKAFATKTLPTLQKHLKMAQELHTTQQGAVKDADAVVRTSPATSTAK